MNIAHLIRYTILPIWVGLLSIIANAQNSETYWQQEVDYLIHVSLDDNDHILEGDISITYHNHSPYKLDTLFIHLWPNAYANDQTAFARQQVDNNKLDFHYSNPTDRGFIDRLDFEANGEKLMLNRYKSNPDIGYLILPSALMSGSSIDISTPFRVKIPADFSRLGHIGQSYQVTQWYPKPAVYDKNGWHPMPYLDQGEFYSEFGSFEVHITLPENYVVAATGVLQNENERARLSRLSDETRELIKKGAQTGSNEFPPSESKTKTLVYKLENTHDFAWFADKRYHVLIDSVRLPSGKIVESMACFTPGGLGVWKKADDYLEESTLHYSNLVGEYPYPVVQAVEGALSAGGGMEYPTITVIVPTRNAGSLRSTLLHEVGHNWFYGILASNERDFPWMDEGINTYYQLRFFADSSTAKTFPAREGLRIPDLINLDEEKIFRLINTYQSRQGFAQAPGLKSELFSNINYGVMVYGKVSLSFMFLEYFLGSATFDRAMQAYFDNWKFKHPYPQDFWQVMESSTGQSLKWFREGYIETAGGVDYAIKRVTVQENMVSVSIVNKGDVNSPVSIALLKDGQIYQSLWVPGFRNDTIIQIESSQIPDRVEIDPHDKMLDICRQNNFWNRKRLFNLANPVSFQFLLASENPRKNQVLYTPIATWNNNDRWSFGFFLYNNILPSWPLEFEFMPLYGVHFGEFVGEANVRYHHIFSHRKLRKVTFGIDAASYHDNDFVFDTRFGTVKPYLAFEFRPEDKRNRAVSRIELSTNYLNREYVISEGNNGDYTVKMVRFHVNKASFSHENKRAINPSKWELEIAEAKKDWLVSATYQTKLNIRSLKNGIGIRCYAGLAPTSPNLGPMHHFTHTLGMTNGSSDYAFAHRYLDRRAFEGLLYRQLYPGGGRFKIPMDKFPFGKNLPWLLALNLDVPLPVSWPVSLFADMATFKGAGSSKSLDKVLMEAGISVGLIPGILVVHCPVLMSRDVRQAFNNLGNNYFQRLTFQLNLDMINPTKVVRNLSIN